MKVDLNPVIWNEVMDICIDIEKGAVDHVDGTAKIQSAVEKFLSKQPADRLPNIKPTVKIANPLDLHSAIDGIAEGVRKFSEIVGRLTDEIKCNIDSESDEETIVGKCAVCKSIKKLLTIDDDQGVCDDCAQYMNDMRP